jgi:poly(hydroxyalkanoate) depolymerase family esterase
MKMDGIAETLRRLTAARRGMGGDMSGRPAYRDRLQDVASFGPNPGQLACRAYVPAGLGTGSPLVLVLHGCTQTAAGYDDGSGWSTLADQAGFALVFAQQTRTNNANLCFNWFEPGDIARDGGEAHSIRSMVEHMVATHRLDPARVFVTGLSAGGAMTAVMLATNPELFAGGAIIAGVPYASAGNLAEALQRMRGDHVEDAVELAKRLRAASGHSGPWPKLAIWHGEEDRTVALSNAHAIADSWALLIGAPREPTQLAEAGRHKTRSWMAPNGEVMLELHSVAGMAHGTPIASGDAPGSGRAAPHMLDVGIASTRCIAESWGIAWPQPAETAANKLRPLSEPPPNPSMGSFAVRGPENVRHTIEGALRAAGLMR